MIQHLETLYLTADAAYWEAVHAHEAALQGDDGGAIWQAALGVELAAAHRDAVHALIEIAEGRDPRRVQEEHTEHIQRACALVAQEIK